MAGTAEYGYQGENNQEWSIGFKDIEFDQFKFSSGDDKHWLIATKESVQGDGELEVLASSENSDKQTIEWKKPQINLEDGRVLYNEGSSVTSVDYLRDNGGAKLYIRVK